MLRVEFKGSMAAESSYLKISASTSHIVFMAKTKLRPWGRGTPHVFVSEKCRIFKLESLVRLLLPHHSF